MKISEANRNVLKSVGKVFIYLLLPVLVFSFYFDDAIFNAIYDNGLYYLVALFFAGMFDAMRDKCAFHYEKSIFSRFNRKFFDAEISWINKYKDGIPSNGRRMLFWKIPVFSVFTDAWHLFKGFHTLLICTAVVSYVPFSDNILIDFLVAYLFYKWSFNAFFNWILIKR